ncbi:DUF2142 domain-containing protein [Pseudolysinimonas sp.]|uniref:DUF2142 domain-containing protein n=1 Tax=Pseudolysinimonas sp. TaxID=2680009 RepID=UPI003F801C8E
MFLLTLLVGWGLSSPVGSSPDDDYHLPSIWCGLGERPGLCQPASKSSEREVPLPIASGGAPCYYAHPNRSAACVDLGRSGLSATSRVDTAHGYPPVFYGVMSVMASPDVGTSVVAMRIFNSALAVAVFTTLFWCLPRPKRAALVVSVAASVVPLGLFIIPSTNPSSWAIISAVTVWLATWGAVTTRGRRQWALSALIVIGSLIGAGARADAAGFAVFGIMVGLLLGLRRDSAKVIPLSAIGVSSALAVTFYLTSGQSAASTAGLEHSAPALSVRQMIDNATGIPYLWSGVYGAWPLGWIDTPLPLIVPAAAVAVAVAVIFIGLRPLTLRRGLALGSVASAAYFYPWLLLLLSHVTVGGAVQPRYLLPLIIIGLGVAAASPRTASAWRGSRQAVASGALMLAICVAFYFNMRRYTGGLKALAIDPGRGGGWWWAAVPSPLTVEVSVVVSVAGLLAILVWINSRPSRDAELAARAD